MANHLKPQSAVSHLKEYVPGTPIEEVQRKYGVKDAIKLASNENMWGPSPRAIQAIAEALDQINYYPDTQCYELRNALAKHLSVLPDQIIPGNGADGVISQICLAYLDNDSEVVVSRSSFPVYDTFTTVMRGKIVKVPMKDFRLDLDGMLAAINERTRVVFVCNPNNPTGTIVLADEVQAFMDRVPENVLVILDEAYFEMVDSDQFPDSLAYVREGRENVMVMRSFSKVYGIAGVRLGYGVAQPSVLEPLHRVKEVFAVNRLAQAAGIAALSDQEYVQRSVRSNHESRLWLYDAFDEMGIFYLRSHANFVLVRIGPNAVKVQQELLRKGVIVRPCTGYDLPEFLRVTVGTLEQDARLIEALKTVI